MNKPQVITLGTVIGFVPGQPDFVKITDGIFTVYAYVSFRSPQVQVGHMYNVYKQGSTYFIGTRIEGR